MTERSFEYYKIGDPVPTYWIDREGNLIPESWTVLEIHERPNSEREVENLVTETISKYHSVGRTGVTLISGANLADNPDLAPFVELDKIYVMEI